VGIARSAVKPTKEIKTYIGAGPTVCSQGRVQECREEEEGELHGATSTQLRCKYTSLEGKKECEMKDEGWWLWKRAMTCVTET
jgi:hypothetical protein